MCLAWSRAWLGSVAARGQSTEAVAFRNSGAVFSCNKRTIQAVRSARPQTAQWRKKYIQPRKPCRGGALKSQLPKFSGKSHCGRYRGSCSSVRVGNYLPGGVRIRNEYPHVAATRCLLLRVFKPAPEGGVLISDTPATASAPPDPAHDRQSALRLGSHTPAQAPSTTPPSVGAVALGP